VREIEGVCVSASERGREKLNEWGKGIEGRLTRKIDNYQTKVRKL
jgi:hypothetical protein